MNIQAIIFLTSVGEIDVPNFFRPNLRICYCSFASVLIVSISVTRYCTAMYKVGWPVGEEEQGGGGLRQVGDDEVVNGGGGGGGGTGGDSGCKYRDP